jgi:hypothetical protein
MKVRAKMQLAAAKSQALTIAMLAEAEKDAQIIRAVGATAAAKKMEGNASAMEIYAQENKVRTAQALGGKCNVMIGMDSPNSVPGILAGSFAAFSDGKPQESLSLRNLQQAHSPRQQQ